MPFIYVERENAIRIVLKLIKKQQKEIEELSIIKNGIKALQLQNVNSDTYYLIAKNDFLNGSYRNALDDFISKDKIREKIKEEQKEINIIEEAQEIDNTLALCNEKAYRQTKIEAYRELLEENKLNENS